ncbi:hypothetical protein IW261DRAFT_1562073 [Armillaria novae-zelandiae]|uniref:Uncharacterized protein n=1 Tax=Armillaria novae-zelandiae TaxID=153914 RepID=A0AA39UAQ7_9AGAR|nr:hypothetical protein IW261DRAFT_1562073 [Armillaria novae-zelandiae]
MATKSAFVGAYISTFLYGAYIVIAYHCSLVMYHRYKTKQLHMYLLGTHVALFLLINLRCITTIVRTLYAITHQEPDGTINLHPLWSSWSLVENSAWVLTVLVADAFLIYRTFIVWMNKCTVVVVPLLLFVADAGAGIYVLVILAKSTTMLHRQLNANRAFGVMTLVVNVVCTALISYRIWIVRRNVSGTRLGPDPLTGVIALIVESAVVYTVLLICLIITLGLGSFVYYVLFDIQSAVIGIVFSMIIIRVSQGQAHGDTSTDAVVSSVIRWQGSTDVTNPPGAEVSNLEIRLETVIGTHHDNVETQHEGSKPSNETDHESVVSATYKT